MHRLPAVPATLLAAVVLATAGCGSETTPLEAGLEPLGTVEDVAWPAPLGQACPESIQINQPFPVFAVPSYSEGHARACLRGTLAQVWAAMQIPQGVQLNFYPERNETDCEARLDVETGYPVSFLTKEIPHGVIERNYTFEITWRIGVVEGTEANPLQVNVKYGKTYGTTEVPWIKGTVVLFEDPPGTVRMEIIRQVNTNGHSDEPTKLRAWMQGYFDAMQIALSTTPPGTALPRLCPGI